MTDSLFIFTSEINSFHYLYGDAEYLRSILARSDDQVRFEAVRLSRSAILLYIFSLEALINKALGAFLPEKLRLFFIDREAKLGTQDKWQLLPLVATSDPNTAFDLSAYPWSHFVELVTLRNDYVHPKHSRPAYYKAITTHQWTARGKRYPTISL
jgi:hypothetical protein